MEQTERRKIKLGEEAACPECRNVMIFTALDLEFNGQLKRIEVWLCRKCRAMCSEDAPRNPDSSTAIFGYYGGS